MRAGLGVRDGAPSPHAGHATPPLPWGPGATGSAQPGVPAWMGSGGGRGLGRTLTQPPRSLGPPALLRLRGSSPPPPGGGEGRSPAPFPRGSE